MKVTTERRIAGVTEWWPLFVDGVQVGSAADEREAREVVASLSADPELARELREKWLRIWNSPEGRML